jgi:hypothetical protein
MTTLAALASVNEVEAFVRNGGDTPRTRSLASSGFDECIGRCAN